MAPAAPLDAPAQAIMPHSPDKWRVLHLSDVHFSEPWRFLFFGLRNPVIPQKHNLELLRGLRNTVERELEPIDLVVVTGDVSTNGSTSSLELAFEYFSRKGVTRPTGKALTIPFGGLGIDPRRLIVVPGNHDRYRYLPLQIARRKRLEAAFQLDHAPLRTAYPTTLRFGEESSDEGGRAATAPNLTFYLFDSTLSGRALRRVANPIDSLARGQLSDRDLRILREGGGSPADVKIAVLHHHPTLSERLTTTLRIDRRYKRYLTTMIDADGARTAFRAADVRLVLYGHRHYRDFHRPDGDGPAYFCCRSTAENRASRRRKLPQLAGFWVYDIWSDGVIAHDFVWRNHEFVRNYEGAVKELWAPPRA